MTSIFVITVTRSPGSRDFEHTSMLGYVHTERQAIDFLEKVKGYDEYMNCELDYEELENLEGLT